MDEVIRVAGFALVATIMLAVVREQQPSVARHLGLVAGLMVFAVVLWRLGSALAVIQDLSARAGIPSGQLSVVLRSVGIAYITEFAAAACRDAGESALAAKVELAGKVAILLIAVPVIVTVFDLVFRLLA